MKPKKEQGMVKDTNAHKTMFNTVIAKLIVFVFQLSYFYFLQSVK